MILLLLLRNAMTTNTFSCAGPVLCRESLAREGRPWCGRRRSPTTTVRRAIAAPMAGETANGWPGDVAANGWLNDAWRHPWVCDR